MPPCKLDGKGTPPVEVIGLPGIPEVPGVPGVPGISPSGFPGVAPGVCPGNAPNGLPGVGVGEGEISEDVEAVGFAAIWSPVSEAGLSSWFEAIVGANF